MRLMRHLPKIAFLAALSAGPSVLATPYDTLQSIAGAYNVFLTGNLGTASAPFQNSDTEGNVAVAGNAYLSGDAINGNNTSGEAALVVGGSLTDNSGSVNGNVFAGGSVTLTGGATIKGSLSLTGANTTLSSGDASSPTAIYTTSSTTVNDPSYWTKAQTSGGPATPLDVFGTSTDVTNASTSLTALSGATNVSSTGGTINIALSKNGLNVIDLTLSNGATVNSINITDANGVIPTGLIINVNGNNLNFTNGSFTYPSNLSANQVLYNFGNATSISASGIAFQGALLAPLATVNFSNGQLDGALIANNYTGSAQINYIGFNDPLPAYQTSGSGLGSGTVVATPEPASIFLFGGGLIVLALNIRRHMIRGAATA